MKKIIMTAVAVLGFAFANAQSHQQGTMQVNVMGGFLVGGSATAKDDAEGSEKIKFSATGVGFGVHFQYGLAENFSAGIGLETGTNVLTPKDLAGFEGTSVDFTNSAFKVMLSGRYYLVNKDQFNLYAGPSVGFTTGKDKTSIAGFDLSDNNTKYSGLNYGLNVGANYFFTDIVGVIMQVGYTGTNLKSTTTVTGFADETGKTSISGVGISAGLALKF